MKPAHIYMIIASLVSLLLFGLDKLFAKNRMRRIPEKTLLAVAALGGGLGALLGMVFFNHKTSKPAFRYTVPLIFLFYLAAFIYFV